jgi:cobalt/nickel transport system permease protein
MNSHSHPHTHPHAPSPERATGPAAPAKLILALAFVSVVALAPAGSWMVYGIATGALAVVSLLARIPAYRFLVRLLWLEPFALGVGVMALAQDRGLLLFASLIWRANLCLAAVLLLGLTTPFGDAIAALRRFRVPSLLVTTLALLHRYLFVLSDEMHRMRRARRSRSFGSRRTGQWRTLSSVVAHLFIRSTERAERVNAAMCARGWTP